MPLESKPIKVLQLVNVHDMQKEHLPIGEIKRELYEDLSWKEKENK